MKVEFIDMRDELIGHGEYDADVVIGVYGNIRGTLMGKFKVPSIDSITDLGAWHFVLALRFGIHAFATGAIIDPPPAQIQPLKYKVVIMDTCELNTDCVDNSGIQKALLYAKHLLFGNGHKRKPASLLLGGQSMVTSSLVPWASSLGIPSVSLHTNTPPKGKNVPYYYAAGPESGQVASAMFALTRKLGYKRIAFWPSLAYRTSFVVVFTEMAASGGETFATFYMKAGPVDGLQVIPNDPRLAEYETLANLAKQFNAHYHLTHWQQQDPKYDILHYFVPRGLVGPGHLWVHVDAQGALEQLYCEYVEVTTQWLRLFHGSKPWTGLLPFDGSLNLQVKWKGPKVESEFEPWLFGPGGLSENRHIFEDWWLQAMYRGQNLFKEYSNATRWLHPDDEIAFEMMWASMSVLNNLALKHGSTDFDPEEVLQGFKDISFEGLSGKHETSPSGPNDNWPTRVTRWIVTQYRQCETQNNSKYEVLLYQLEPQQKRTFQECQAIPKCNDRILQTITGDPSRYGNCGSGGECPDVSVWTEFEPDPVYSTKPTMYPAPNIGRSVLFAEMLPNGEIEISGEYVGYNCSRQLPPDLDLPCPAGEWYDRTLGECFGCLAGTFSGAVASTECTDCPMGTYTANDRESVCRKCLPGSFTIEAKATACGICAEGTISKTLAAESCTDCEPGTFSSQPGQPICKICDRGSFSDQIKSTTCTSCAADRTTVAPGATNGADCRCAEGTYTEVGLGLCKPCKEGMACPFGSTVAAWFNQHFEEGHPKTYEADVAILEGSYPILRPGFFSYPNKPLSIFACESGFKCPGGNPGTCGEELVGLSCQHCRFGFTWDGKACAPCTSTGNVFVFPVLPLILPALVLPILHWLAFEPAEVWSTLPISFKLESLVFILLNFGSTVNILGSAVIEPSKVLAFVMDATPGEIVDDANITDFNGSDNGTELQQDQAKDEEGSGWNAAMLFALTNDLSGLFDVACAGYGGFQKMATFKLCFPAVVGAWALVLAVGSRQLARIVRKPILELDMDIMCGTFMSIMLTFFNAVVAVSLTLFKCTTNPNGTDSLLADIAVICYEDDWKSMLGLSIVAIIVYCIGYMAVLARVMWVAPANMHKLAFQKRFGFVFKRYRADIFWWGLVFTVKNVLQNISFVLFSTVENQIYWFMGVSLVYMVWLVLCMPYRFVGGTGLDSGSNACVVLLCSVLTNFILSVDADALSDLGSSVSFLAPLTASGVLVWLTWTGWQNRADKQLADPEQVMWDMSRNLSARLTHTDLPPALSSKQIRAAMHFCLQIKDDPFVTWIDSLDYVNRQNIRDFKRMIHTDGLGTGFDRRLTACDQKHAVEQSGLGMHCELRHPCQGEIVYSRVGLITAATHDGEYRGWLLLPDEPAEVALVTDSGDFSLVNTSGIESVVFQRNMFVYQAPPKASDTAEV